MPRSYATALLLSITLVSASLLAPAEAPKSAMAATPPMGWNSWDAYGLTIDEAGYRANTTVLAGLKQFGWLLLGY